MSTTTLPDSIALAYGGNALKGKGPDGKTIEAQEKAMTRAAQSIAAIRQVVSKILVVHGNGPQVGWMGKRSDIAMKKPHNMHPVHLRNAGASSQGAIGTSMAKQVVNEYTSLHGKVMEVGTQVRVDEKDQAFENPTKPVGDFMNREESEEMKTLYGWEIQERTDGPEGKPFRRVVPSPEPIGIEEIKGIELLINNEIVTICVGGGGVPFILKPDGTIVWVDAVIDKDAAAALAAILLEIKMLAIFTAEDGIYEPGDFKKKQRGDTSVKPIPEITAAALAQMDADLPDGSMGPKAKAVGDFVSKTENTAWVGPLDDGYEALTEGRGTTIVPS